MSATYDFIVDLARNHCSPPARLLDFGCGAGEVVDKAARIGFDAWGVDSFAENWMGAYGDRVGSFRDRIVKVSDGDPLPFDDGSFDVVVTNQVMEHIADLQPVVRDLGRVLRRGGMLVAIFPTREIIVEPHVKAPFVHRLPPGSPEQERALDLVHRLKLCRRAQDDRQAWVARAAHSLKKEIFYRTEAEAIAVFQPHFRLLMRQEAAFIRDRIARSSKLRRLAPLFASRWMEPVLRTLCVRLANVVLVLQRS